MENLKLDNDEPIYWDYYAVRIDGSLSISAEIITAVKKYHLDSSFSLYISHEVPNKENPHYHILFYCDKIEAFRKYIKRKLKIGGNKDYSISRCDNKQKYLAYIMKEGNEIYKSGITDEELKEASDRVLKIEADKGLSLTEKVFNHLENLEIDYTDEILFMGVVLKYFKENKLSYPQRHWMSQLRVKFLMESKSRNSSTELIYDMKLARIYGFDDFIKDK